MDDEKPIFAYAVLTKLIFSNNFRMTELNKRGLTMSQMFALTKLDECGIMNLTTLARGIQVSNQVMTGITNKLVEEGYIERVYSPENRRQILVQLTQQGKAFMHEYYEEVYKTFGDIFKNCSQEDLQTVLRASRDLIRVLSGTDHSYGEQYMREIETVLND